MADMNKSSESAIKAAFTEAFESVPATSILIARRLTLLVQTNAKLHAAKELRAAHASGGTTMTVRLTWCITNELISWLLTGCGRRWGDTLLSVGGGQ